MEFIVVEIRMEIMFRWDLYWLNGNYAIMNG